MTNRQQEYDDILDELEDLGERIDDLDRRQSRLASILRFQSLSRVLLALIGRKKSETK